jgi:hypothetical protein
MAVNKASNTLFVILGVPLYLIYLFTKEDLEDRIHNR